MIDFDYEDYEVGDFVEFLPYTSATPLSGTIVEIYNIMNSLQYVIESENKKYYLWKESIHCLLLGNCRHTFKEYLGFTDKYDYCTKCGEKRV